jgi:Xaa-Pro aminopeptidase
VNIPLQNLRDAFRTHHIDSFLVTKDENISYLTEYASQESWLLVCKKKAFFLTDGRYSLHAKGFLKEVEVVECKKSIFDELAKLIIGQKARSLGFDDRYITVLSFQRLKQALKGKIRFVGSSGIVEETRSIKRSDELAKIKKALDFHRQCLIYLKQIIRVGRSERQVFERLERYVRDHHQQFSFPAIIASGPNASFPHARITERKFRRGDPVLVDMGIDIEGYKSDLTRMFFLGKISHHMREVYDAVAQAQRLAIAKIKPGVLAKDIDAQARNFLKQKKLDVFFNHSLGHGVGLEIHEAPGISPKSLVTIKEGMVFTVEPGVYIPDQFGIRIEDMVLVTSKGHKVLSQF